MDHNEVDSGGFLSVLQDADTALWFGLFHSFTTVVTFPKTRQGTAWCPAPHQFPQQQRYSEALVPQMSATCLDTCSSTYASQTIGKFYFTYKMVRNCLFKLTALLGAFSEKSCKENNSFERWFLQFEVFLHNKQCCANPLSHAEATRSPCTRMWAHVKHERPTE